MSRDYMTAKFCILMHIHSVFSDGNEFAALNKNVICRSVILRLFHRGCDSIIQRECKLRNVPVYFPTGAPT